jgi:ATP adenylyltransferase
MKQPCPFCNIHPERNLILRQTKSIAVLLSNPREMPGHLLVIPKRHVEKPSQLTASERKELFGTIILYQEKILSRISEGCDISQHHRPFQKQNNYKVDHLHFHLKPRKMRDRLFQLCERYEKEVFGYPTKKELNKISLLLN